MKRTRYQFGSVYRKERKRGAAVWVYRYFDSGKRKSVVIGSVEKYSTKAEALKASEGLRLVANPEKANAHEISFGALIDRYIADELPERKSTGKNYLSWIENHIRPKWGDYSISEVAKPFPVEQWLKGIKLAPRSKVHIRSAMSLIFASAMRWELLQLGNNPMSHVRITDSSKKLSELSTAKLKQLGRKPRLRKHLSFEETRAVLSELQEPFRTMVVVAVCLGIRASEIAGLKWGDFDWKESLVFIQRGIVAGIEDDVKTSGSKTTLPLDPALVEVLLQHRARWRRTGVDWVFQSSQGDRPYSMHYIQQRILEPAGIRAGVGAGLGWHSFRHTYSTLLRHLKVDVKVQQALLRHTDIRTTMNTYTEAVADDMRRANSNVVQMVLKGTKTAKSTGTA